MYRILESSDCFDKGTSIFDLEVGNVEKITADIIDKFYDNESTEKRTGKRNIKKFSGAVTAEYFRSKIEEILSGYPKYKISDNNVYIKEYPMEFDFLILKSDAQKINGIPVYEADKVVAILESKKNGVYKTYNEEKRNEFKEFDLDPLAEAYFKLQGPAKNIRLGYMTMSENRPKKEDGKSDLIRGTWLYFQDKFLNQGILNNLLKCYLVSTQQLASNSGKVKDIKDFIEALDLIEESMFISLDAKWGSGKTFYVRQIEQTLNYFLIGII